jgi:hypothetical protein
MTPLPKSSRDWRRNVAAEEAFAEAQRRMAAAAVELSKAIEEMAGTGHWKAMGCASVGVYAEMCGVPGGIARTLRRLPEVLRAAPQLEAAVVEGRYGFEAVANLWAFVEDPSLLKEGETLEGLLEHRTGKQVLRLARARRIEKKDPTKRNRVTVDVTDEGADDLERVREFESQRQQRCLTLDEAVEAAAHFFVEKHDLLKKTPRRRRMADTTGKPGRGVPAEVERYLLATYGRKCLLWWCDADLIKQNAHIKSKRRLGGQEARNLIPPCCGHHLLYDLGFLFEAISGGRRFLMNRYGMTMGEIFEPPAELFGASTVAAS